MKARALHLVRRSASSSSSSSSSSSEAEDRDTLAFRRVASGDVGALGEIYDRHAVALLRFASRVAGQACAEDLVHATFMRVVSIASTYDSGRSTNANAARSWLFGIMARLIQEQRRSLVRLARVLKRFAEIAPTTTTTTTTTTIHNDHPAARSDLERGLLALSEAKRVVIVLAEVEGYACDEIARMLEIPVGTVWTRLHHARKEMRAFYDGEAR